MKRPLAVVVVTYNSAAVIEDCLAALPDALGDVGDTRVIVVDNDSTDDTVKVAKTYPVRVIERGSNDGFAAGVNAGIDAATAAADGCDVLVLNADIRLAPGSVATLRDSLTRSPAGIAVPRLVGPDGELHPSLRRTPTVPRVLGEALLGGTRAGRLGVGELMIGPRAYAKARLVDWASGAAWLISRECLDVAGRLDERYLLYSEETDYMLRATAASFPVRYEPDAVATHLGGEVQSSSPLWTLLTANRVRLHRERHGRLAGVLMRLALILNEALRSVRGTPVDVARHRAALRGLIRLRRWPKPLYDKDNPPYVCFSAQDWWYHNQAHSDFQLLRRVAETRTVLLVNSIGLRMPLPGRSTQFARRVLRKARSVAKLVRTPVPELPRFHVMTPLVLPFYGKPLLRKANAVLVRAQVKAVSRALGIREPVVVVTIPTAWDVVAPMRRRSLVFNRSDRHSAFPESDEPTIRALEDSLLRESDHVLYVSRALQHDESEATGERAHFLDHGVDLDHFRRRTQRQIPRDLAEVPGLKIGFFGSLDDYLVDFDLLERVAAEIPEASLVLIGDATCSMERFDKYPNVHWLGFRPYERIPAYGSGFDVALMPWLSNEWITHANPIKMKEYLALGLAVVSTDFPEVARYREVIRVAGDHARFVELIRDSLADGGPRTPELRRVEVADASWDSRAAALMALAERPDRPCAE
ncbi:GT2 family glycosyltransferase [Herbihabitans rhizosphaerae]|uniref:GT2 family glycosyltransferase n=1 Tax=Herbihabitans rhizosphaerae TaxID=1872711 RepID=A0A4Q7L8E8_9PSEU|nr:glycosyltransferase [Herbihabitans rhizosphaerae]RZS44672.1 GT2 family glycosyltransferase [Herbihabitans rhizosphaerae]